MTRYPYVHIDVPSDESEAVSDQLWVLGASGVEERDATTLGSTCAEGETLLIASFDTEENAQQAARTLGRGARVEYVEGDAWRDGWREYFKVTQVTPRIIVRPSWEEAGETGESVVLTIDPGNAFGSGLHETTRLVLGEVDARIAGGEAVLDVGCGSGILSIAALLLGAKSALGTDIDPIALETTMENATLNGVADHMATAGPELGKVEGTYPLVLANIQAHVLVPMAEQLIAKVAPGGTLVLSGVLGEQVDDVLPAFSALTLETVREENEWRAIVLTRGAA